ncbi:MAG: hypothetical protein AAGA80_07280 [Cyanobacteria bacterium P01_F01_bin.143]
MSTIRQKISRLIEQLSDEQLAVLLPLILSIQDNQVTKETSQAYKNWVGAENDIYDEIFADDLAAR